MTQPVEIHPLRELYPLYQEYLDTFLIPAYRRYAKGVFGPPTSHAGYIATKDLLEALMEEPFRDISGYPQEAIAGMNWVTTRAIDIILNPSNDPDAEIKVQFPTTFNRVKKLQMVMVATWMVSYTLNCEVIQPESRLIH